MVSLDSVASLINNIGCISWQRRPCPRSLGPLLMARQHDKNREAEITTHFRVPPFPLILLSSFHE